jgi:hypothetical protein
MEVGLEVWVGVWDRRLILKFCSKCLVGRWVEVWVEVVVVEGEVVLVGSLGVSTLDENLCEEKLTFWTTVVISIVEKGAFLVSSSPSHPPCSCLDVLPSVHVLIGTTKRRIRLFFLSNLHTRRLEFLFTSHQKVATKILGTTP